MLTACAPHINPNDVTRVAIEGAVVVVDETLRNAPKVIDAAGQAAAARHGSQSPQPSPYYGPPQPSPYPYPYPGGPAPYQGGQPAALPPLVVPENRVVQVRFIGDGAESRWALEAGGKELCETPCTLRYASGMPISMLERGGVGKPARMMVPYLPSGTYEAAARPRSLGAFAPGVVATAFGGMGAITGIVLTSVGCPQGKTAMCNGGLITAGASTAVMSLGIVLVVTSEPEISVEPRAP